MVIKSLESLQIFVITTHSYLIYSSSLFQFFLVFVKSTRQHSNKMITTQSFPSLSPTAALLAMLLVDNVASRNSPTLSGYPPVRAARLSIPGDTQSSLTNNSATP